MSFNPFSSFFSTELSPGQEQLLKLFQCPGKVLFITQGEFYKLNSAPEDLAKAFHLLPDIQYSYCCPTCGRKLKCRKGQKRFSCANCLANISLYSGTWFEGSDLSIENIFEICWAFCEGETANWCTKNIRRPDQGKIYKLTVQDWYAKCRNVIWHQVLWWSGECKELKKALPSMTKSDVVSMWRQANVRAGQSQFIGLLVAISKHFQPEMFRYLYEPPNVSLN